MIEEPTQATAFLSLYSVRIKRSDGYPTYEERI